MTGSTGSEAYHRGVVAPRDAHLEKLEGSFVRISALGRLEKALDSGQLWWRLGTAADKDGERVVWFRGDTSALTAEAIAPTEWPPQAGDIWEDGAGQVWFFYLSEHDQLLAARNATGGYVGDDPAAFLLNAQRGGLILRHRHTLNAGHS